MTDPLTLLSVDQLVIPFWQMATFILILSLFVLARSYKVSLITTYLFTLYWGFSLYFSALRSSFGTYPGTIYVVLGFCHVGLTLLAFRNDKSRKS